MTPRRPSLDDLPSRLTWLLARPPECQDDRRIGHRLTQAAGPARCTLGIPWATSAGVNLRLLHGAYAARRVSETRYADSTAVLINTRQQGRLLRLSGRGQRASGAG